MITTVIFLVELLISITVFIWIAAMLGFADDAHRNQKARLSGRILVVTGICIASLPLLVTLYAGLCYYFPEKFLVKVPLGWWMPIIIAAGSFAIGLRIAKRYDASYKKGKKHPHH